MNGAVLGLLPALVASLGTLQEPAAPCHGILSSQIGYDAGGTKRVVVRSDAREYLSDRARFVLVDGEGEKAADGAVSYWGAIWNAHWWVADISACGHPGTYRLRIEDRGEAKGESDPIVIREHALWSACWSVIALDMLDARAEQSRTKRGWRDCGSDLQELSSHVVVLDCLCDALEIAPGRVTDPERRRLLAHLENGGDFLAALQDRAAELGLGDGPLVHEPRQDHAVTGNVTKAAMAFARISRILAPTAPERSADYLNRSLRAYAWIDEHGPVVNEEEPVFFPHVHGAPPGSRPPADQWMTRDLVTMLRASLELVKAGRDEHAAHAFRHAAHIVDRQVPEGRAEDGLYGHFYTFDDFEAFGGVRFTEKANVHCGAWSEEGRIYNKGGHYPHYVLPLIEMGERWPDHPDAARWERAVRDFAYGYFLPGCERSPFRILPAGYWTGEGLLWFSGWYHAHNNAYAFAASLALELERQLDDPRFREVAVGNLQWIAGLNTGLLEETADGDRRYLPVGMIAGVGHRSRGSWSGIPGTICNGFSASEQFRIRPPRAADDRPVYFDDEGYVAHSLPYLAALARLVSYPPATR